MSDPGGRGLLREPSAWPLAGLVAVRVLAAGLLLADVPSEPVTDAYVNRSERVATSPATPYRDFPVEWAPLETALHAAIGGDGVGALATRLILLSFAADIAAALGVGWGWGRRAAATYLLVGLPLLTFLYLRPDPLAIALAVWGLAALARDRERAGAVGGGSLALAVLTNPWALLVVPAARSLRVRLPAVVGFAVVLVVGAAGWYVLGGPKGPFQVLSFREAFGWSTQSVVGNLLDLLTGGATAVETDVVRIGHISAPARLLLAIAFVIGEVLVWRRAWRAGRDAAGAVTLAALAVGFVCWPHLQPDDLIWLVPFAALAFDEGPDKRRLASLAAGAVALTGLTVVGLQEDPDAPIPDILIQLVTFARNSLLLAIVVLWLQPERRFALPRRRVRI